MQNGKTLFGIKSWQQNNFIAYFLVKEILKYVCGHDQFQSQM